MNHLLLRKSTRRILAILIALFIAAFGFARFRAAASAGLFGSGTATQKEAITVRAANPDEPWIKLQPARSLAANFKEATTQVASSALNGSTPLSLASDDFNGDGFPDLVCGYASAQGGLLTIYHGNPEAYSPHDPEVLRGIGRAQFPDPFLNNAEVFQLPEAPSFLGSGDFDRDGRPDLIAAARGSNTLYIFSGNEQGGLNPPERLVLPGAIAALATGKMGHDEGLTDLVVGISATSGPEVLVYEGSRSLMKATPQTHVLAGEVSSLAFGRLDEDQFNDLAIVAGGQVLVLHGGDQSDADNLIADQNAGEIEPIALPFAVKAMTLGQFIWNRDYRTEMALLSEDGTIHIAARGQVDTRPFSADEMLRQRIATANMRAQMEAASKNGRMLTATPRIDPAARRPWAVVEDVSSPASKSVAAAADGPAQFSTAPPVLLDTRISTLPSDDLLVMDPSASQFRILYNESSRPDQAPADAGSVQRSAVDLTANREPVAVLPMRVNVDARPGLVVLTKGSITPSIVFVQPAATITVNDATDTIHSPGCATTGTGTCSLRDAIIFSNNNPGADAITIGAGINPTLTITGNDATADPTKGDLDINDSVTITGNGSGSTTISTTYTSTCGDCKVFGINQDGTHNNLAVSITGAKIQNGFNKATCGTFFETGGGIDLFLTGAGGSLVLSDVILNNNQTTGCAQSYGGGLNIDTGVANTGTVSMTNVSITNNTADTTGGGINLFGDLPAVTINATSSISSNTTLGTGGNGGNGGGINVRTTTGGTLTIHGTTIANNTAKGPGGGVSISGANQAPVTIDNTGAASSITGNTSQRSGSPANVASQGGGLFKGDGVTTTTLINVTISGNHADEAGASLVNSPQGGGILIVGAGGALNMTVGSLSTNTANDVANNKGDGGGIAVTTSPGGTATFTNVTISGNTARINGGGVFVQSGGTTTLDGVSTSTNVGLNGSGVFMNGGAITGANAVSIGENLNIQGGTFTSTPATLSLGGDFTRATGGTFAHNNGTVNFDGGGAQNINGTATSETFNNFTVNKGGGTLTVGGSTTLLTISGNVTLTLGTFAAGTATAIGVTGDWTNNSGNTAFTAGTGEVVFNGTASQTITGSSGISTTFNKLTVNNSGIAINMNNDNTVNDVLALTTADINVATGKTLTQPSTAGASTGTFDVVGSIKRTGSPLPLGLALTFGNPNNLITFNSGAPPTDVTINLVKAAPSGPGFGFSGAVQRTYLITPNGGGVFSATLQLHYNLGDLNGNTAGNLKLWKFITTPITGWQQQPSSVDNGTSAVSLAGVGSFSSWTLANVSPTAANSTVSGRVVNDNGNPVEGVGVRMSGTQNRLTVTDAQGNYHFDNVETNGFYTVVPTRANFAFSPSQRAFSQLGLHTDAAFSASATGEGLNPLDRTEYFVRQQYVDFLGREPDESGFNFWVNNIESCGDDANCRAVKRTDTSAAFFLSIEFQQTGYLVYRMYRSAYGDMPGMPVPLRLGEFRPDTAEISNGVVVLQSGWETVLENNTQAFAAEFVQRSRFTAAYPGAMTPSEFVNKLFTTAGVTPGDSDRLAAINEFGSAATSSDVAARGRALRRVAENSALAQQEFNQAFVLMEYFGYLQRDANSGPDTDFSGYNFWLNKLNTFGGNFQNAEMVKAFLVAGEYRGRFPR